MPLNEKQYKDNMDKWPNRQPAEDSYEAKKMAVLSHMRRNEIPKARKTFTPVGEAVAVQIVQTELTTSKGIIIPEQSAGEWETPLAFVVAVGPKVEQIKDGDVVLVPKSAAAIKIRKGEVELLLLHQLQIVGIIDLPTDEGKSPMEKVTGCDLAAHKED